MRQGPAHSLSVCMATRNGGRFIRPQLASILKQLGPDDEVIVSDDSSTDDTVAVVASFQDPRVRILEHNTFYNPVFNFEHALKAATGAIIALSDQDDIWLDGKVERIKGEMAASTERYFMLILDGEIVDESGKLLSRTISDQTRPSNGVIRNIYDSAYIGCCMAFKRELLQIALPFPRTLPMHDWWLGLLNDLFGTVRFLDMITLHYRRHSSTVTDLPKRVRSLGQVSCRVVMAWHLLVRALAVKFAGKTR